ncbi:MAG: hypothetical protein QOF57_815 [Frankiaceae bacterium]|jgi:hypothetical protein|nr:hypothetical protein [Frankiaceae bacterium]
MTAAPSVNGRRLRFTDYVPVWAIALLTIAVMWVAVIHLATSETFPAQARITAVQNGKCVVQWVSAAGKSQTSDVACLGRHPGEAVTLKLSDPEGITFADPRALAILEWIGLLFTGVPGLLGVAGRAVGIRRARLLGHIAAQTDPAR